MDINRFKFNTEKQNVVRRRLYLTIIVCCIFTVTMAYFTNVANSRRATQVASVNSVRVNTITPTVATPVPSATPRDSEAHLAAMAVVEEDAPVAYPIDDGPVTFTRPANGTILVEFSWDELVYNRTMEDWRVHLGVDFGGDIGASVFAVADGVVQQVGTDDMMGRFIEITHNGGYVSKYYNLQERVAVSEGDAVVKGQVIGGVGNTGVFMVADPPHLHFEMYKDGIMMNPLDVID